MQRVGYRAIKIAHNSFVTKATDLKTIFLKNPRKIDVKTWSHFDICLKQNKIFFTFF